MELRLRFLLAIAIFVFILFILNSIRKDNVSLKYALVWLISGVLMIIAVLIPNFLEVICHFLGFELVSNMVFLIAIMILLVISFSFTVIASRQTQKIRLLVQEISLLKTRVEVLESNEKK